MGGATAPTEGDGEMATDRGTVWEEEKEGNARLLFGRGLARWQMRHQYPLQHCLETFGVSDKEANSYYSVMYDMAVRDELEGWPYE